nr:uncharacterized mitochondrial protein AtMg00810-like [Tanacetum cinerariifolium]
MATKPKLDADLSGKLVDQTNYRSKIGSLIYLTSTRPDIVQAVCYYARYQARPTEKHLKEVKRIFRYLRGTIDMALWYPKDSGFELIDFSDVDRAGCIDTRKSTSEGIQFLGDKLVSWMSKKQDCTAMSPAKAEYVVLSASCAQVENGIIELYFVRTEYQLADMFTKALPKDRFQYLIRRIGNGNIPVVPATADSPVVPERTTVKIILTMSPKKKPHYESKKEAIHLLLTRIRDEIYSTVDACKTVHEMWIAIKRLQQGESLNIQDVKTNLFWEFRKFTSRDGEYMESYYSRFYKMMNEMIRNNLTVATMQVNF